MSSCITRIFKLVGYLILGMIVLRTCAAVLGGPTRQETRPAVTQVTEAEPVALSARSALTKTVALSPTVVAGDVVTPTVIIPTSTPTDGPTPTEMPQAVIDLLTRMATKTPPPSPTSTPLPPTATPVPSPTWTPRPPTATPVPTATTAPVGTVANRNANLRGGPGTGYAVTGGVTGGDALTIVGTNAAGDWYQLESGAWIAAFLVDNAPGGYAVVVAPALPTPLPLPTAAPVVAVDNGRGGNGGSSGGGGSGDPFVCNGGCAEPPDPSCAIKGNVNSRGERIYHMPGGAFWGRTDIKPEEGDRWFCTRAEAEAAHFRASQR